MQRHHQASTRTLPRKALSRQFQSCLAVTRHVLKQSCLHHRPISLPNLQRVFSRHWATAIADLPSDLDPWTRHAAHTAARWIDQLYRAEQPFSRTDWSHYRSLPVPPTIPPDPR